MPPADDRARLDGDAARAVVLVEGESDRLALEALAARRGRFLESEHVAVVPIGGAKNAARYLERFGPHGFGLRLAGLYDVGEVRDWSRGLERAGLGAGLTRRGLEALGFFACEADLEDELIRSLGVAAIERIIAAEGELHSLRTLQRQPAQRGRTPEAHLHRFFGSIGGRKARYAPLLVAALDLSRVPRPLDAVLAHVP